MKVTYLVAETSAGQTIGLINTHLCRPNPAGNVEQLADVMTKRLSDLPVILTGDLNAAEGSDTINYLMGLGAADQGTNPTPLQDSWSLAAKAESKREAGAIPIDWILVADGGGVQIDVTGASAVLDPAQASDHIAITATLQLR